MQLTFVLSGGNTMKSFNMNMTKIDFFQGNRREPDFNNLLKVIKREKPERPTLFELFLNEPLYSKLALSQISNANDEIEYCSIIIKAFRNAGYDYATVHGSNMAFANNRYLHKRENAKTISINEGAVISDQKTFNEYRWPEPDKYDYSRLEKLNDVLPTGMKLMVMGPGGVLENVIGLVGYEQLYNYPQ